MSEDFLVIDWSGGQYFGGLYASMMGGAALVVATATGIRLEGIFDPVFNVAGVFGESPIEGLFDPDHPLEGIWQ